MKAMGGISQEGEIEKGFQGLVFESTSLKKTVLSKIDEELESMFPTVKAVATLKQIRTIKGSLHEHLEKAKKELGL